MTSDADGTRPGQLELTPEQEATLHRAACALVAAGVRREKLAVPELALGDLAEVAVVGVFVTLRKAGNLRGCIGSFTETIRLDTALERAAKGAACHDPRFPPVSPEELPRLTVEVSLLHSRELLPGDPRERAAAIELGRHGLDLQHAGRSGLLLPSVPVDHGWSVRRFLEELCRKAGLPAGSWQEPDALLFRFASTHFGGPFAL
jgi:AmmeMemoRadiSam system protein A